MRSSKGLDFIKAIRVIPCNLERLVGYEAVWTAAFEIPTSDYFMITKIAMSSLESESLFAPLYIVKQKLRFL